jgi:nucleoside-triphosphatase THEP1
MQKIAAGLAARGVPVAGFVREPIVEEGERVGHRLQRLGHEDRAPVTRRGGTAHGPHEEVFCGFVFDHQACAAAKGWLGRDVMDAEVVVIDEVSKLEVAGRGHHDAIVEAIHSDRLVVLSVRADQLFFAMERFSLEEPVASLDLAEGEELDPAPAFVDALLRELRPS